MLDRSRHAALVDARDAAGGRGVSLAAGPRRRQRPGAIVALGGDANCLHQANDRVCLLVQVETASALARIDEIAAVAGVDGVFIGPGDLSASMGLLGQPGHADVQAAIESGFRRIVAAGKAPGILAVDEALARHYIELGARSGVGREGGAWSFDFFCNVKDVVVPKTPFRASFSHRQETRPWDRSSARPSSRTSRGPCSPRSSGACRVRARIRA